MKSNRSHPAWRRDWQFHPWIDPIDMESPLAPIGIRCNSMQAPKTGQGARLFSRRALAPVRSGPLAEGPSPGSI